VRTKAGDVRGLGPGGLFRLKEQKTGKLRQIPLNQAIVTAVQGLLASRPCDDTEPLFRGRKGALPYVSMLVKGWCRAVGCNHGNYAAHSLRKTFGYHQHTTFGVDLPRLMTCFNHSSQGQTLTYIGIQAEEIREVFMNEL
jgi:integrase